jgi:hypothetical protein
MTVLVMAMVMLARILTMMVLMLPTTQLDVEHLSYKLGVNKHQRVSHHGQPVIKNVTKMLKLQVMPLPYHLGLHWQSR